MKFYLTICPNDILEKITNGFGWLKNNNLHAIYSILKSILLYAKQQCLKEIIQNWEGALLVWKQDGGICYKHV